MEQWNSIKLSRWNSIPICWQNVWQQSTPIRARGSIRAIKSILPVGWRLKNFRQKRAARDWTSINMRFSLRPQGRGGFPPGQMTHQQPLNISIHWIRFTDDVPFWKIWAWPISTWSHWSISGWLSFKCQLTLYRSIALWRLCRKSFGTNSIRRGVGPQSAGIGWRWRKRRAT